MGRIQMFEQALVKRLSEALPELVVEPFPQKPAQYTLHHPKGAVLVQYDGSEFKAAPSFRAMLQIQDMRFTVTSVMRDLRSHLGSYNVLDRVTSALLGWRFPGFGPVRQLSEDWVSEKDGIWIYTQAFGAEVYVEGNDMISNGWGRNKTPEEEF